MKTRTSYSPEVRERAVRMVLTSEREYSSRWAAIQSIAAKIGCTPETLRSWIYKVEANSSEIQSVSNDTAARLKALERENKELKRANEILKKAAAFFAVAELDRKPEK